MFDIFECEMMQLNSACPQCKQVHFPPNQKKVLNKNFTLQNLICCGFSGPKFIWIKGPAEHRVRVGWLVEISSTNQLKQFIPYLEDHPRTCKWLGSPPFISHEKAIWKGQQPYLGDLPAMVIHHLTSTPHLLRMGY